MSGPPTRFLLFRAFLGVCLLSSPAIHGPAAATEVDTVPGLLDQNNLQEASRRLEHFLAEHPGDARARFLEGVLLTEQGRADDAMRAFKALIAEFPDLPEPYINLAVLEAARGNYQAASEALTAALGTSPTYAAVHRNLNAVYAQMARSAFAKAIDADVNNPVRGERMMLIEQLGEAQSRWPAERAIARGAPQQAAMRSVSTALVPEDVPPPRSTGMDPNAVEKILASVQGWQRAWSSRDVEGYLGFYGHHFSPPAGLSRRGWEARRRQRISTPSFIELTISDPSVEMVANDRARVSFVQIYRSNTFAGRTRKILWMARAPEGWKIVRELTPR